MPKMGDQEIWGKQGNSANSTPNYEIPNSNIDLNSSGEANLPIKIYNDNRSDGDNVIVLKIEEPTSPASGFSKDIYEFQEADGVPFGSLSDKTFNIGLTTKSSIQTAYVVIRDDEKPNRKTQGTEQSDTIDFRGAANSDTTDDTIYAGKGDDIVYAGKGDDIVFGQQGNDTLWGEEGNDFLFGGDGNDHLIGGDGNDYLDGGPGADTLEGGTGNDTYIVDNPNDKIIDSPGTGIEKVIASVDWTLGSGLDNLTLTGSPIKGIGNNLNNEITGNDKNNFLDGKEGNDTLYGYSGDDNLVGGVGDDKLYAGDGNDYLLGGDGNDTLVGGDGSDTLTGGAGADKFVFDAYPISIDTITDFNWQEGDKIEIYPYYFTGATSTDQFSYNSNTGALFFDASASDNINPIQFATVKNQSGTSFIPSQDITLV